MVGIQLQLLDQIMKFSVLLPQSPFLSVLVLKWQVCFLASPPPPQYVFEGNYKFGAYISYMTNFRISGSFFATRLVCNALKSQSVQSEQQAAPTLNKTLKTKRNVLSFVRVFNPPQITW